jgi:hypothetical protein
MATIHRPIRFTGTEAQRRTNFNTHLFLYDSFDEETRCDVCDCRPSHAAASYPCGAIVPRETVEVPR